jgi:hypothetical protein
MLKLLSTSLKTNISGVDHVQDLGHKISSYASALFRPPEPSVKAPPLSRDPSRCLDYTPDLQRSAGVYSCTASQFLHCCISLTHTCSAKQGGTLDDILIILVKDIVFAYEWLYELHMQHNAGLQCFWHV